MSVARNYRYFCSDPGQAIIKKDIADFKLQRVVVASCSPRMHEPTFRGTISQAGLNPYFLEMANIREHCSWVHKDRESASAKAFALIRGAVAKAALLMPLHQREVSVIPAALVVGGGAAGLRAARNIADAGFEVFVVEKEPILGGRVVRLANVAPSLEKAIDVLRDDLAAVASHPNIEALTNARVTAVEGYYGNFKVMVDRGQGTRDTGQGTRGTREAASVVSGGTRTLSVGCVIVATGSELFDPRLRPELGYGLYDNVITGFELEQILSNGGVGPDKIVLPGKRRLPTPRSIVLVKCVGSRDKNVGNEYCSRVCCSATAKHALL
ncbi:MAG: FAD-dependent oxidoreductase, partial [Planctomycetota bacterium]|nr:FAD-dependent oxidoreductase [Planctomycetota bacterium]